MAVDPVQVADCDRREIHLRLVSEVSVGDDRIFKKVNHNLVNTIGGEVSKNSENNQPDGGSDL